jgi:hypothetical protein
MDVFDIRHSGLDPESIIALFLDSPKDICHQPESIIGK